MGIDIESMNSLLKQFGVKSEKLKGVKAVIIDLEDKQIVVDNAEVIEVWQGSKAYYQISGKSLVNMRDPAGTPAKAKAGMLEQLFG